MVAPQEPFRILGYTTANFGKEKNGDSFLFEELAAEELLIAVVADGVSQQPCDWLASATSCRAVIDYFTQNEAEPDLGRRLLHSIRQASQEVAQAEGQCQRMASTLSVVVCRQTGDCCYANVGDSRIYSLYQGSLTQLTKDDVTLRREQVRTSAGLRIIDQPVLTQVMGQDRLALDVKSTTIRPGEILVLATDGFYEARKATFPRLMSEFAESDDFEAGFAALIGKLEIMRGDDLTAIALRSS